MTMADTIDVQPGELFNAVWARKQEGCRFITITCISTPEANTLLYHFDRNYKMVHLKVTLRPGEPIRSISGLYLAAVLAENELQDMFGLTVHGLAIDYRGKLLLAEGAPVAPLSKAPLCTPVLEDDPAAKDNSK